MPQVKSETFRKPSTPNLSDTRTPSPAAEREAMIDRARNEAITLSENWTAITFRQVLGLDPETLTLLGARMYLRQSTDGIRDPVEKMLVQQFAVAHHRLMQLHDQASKATEYEAIKLFNSAAARLQGELRRLALAIRQYRQPVTQKSFSVVHQQNVVSGGDQNVQYVDMGKGKESLRSHDELRGKLDPLQERIHGTSLDNGEEPATRTGGQTDRRQAAAVVA